MSQGGREVLIKVVVLVIPTYAMSYFKLPVSFCSYLENMIARFWYGQKGNERKIHWINWGQMCESKFKGELGFRDLRTFNIAILAKQGCQILQEECTMLH